ncbi:hypothetical protein SCP_0403080 [Sparassis crispa]|uniref:Uncharacterized protein n=1 Tax=Sparassis crispa TaxID=139825 RepID=A0A401GIA0_9APHY|nr:hypothetical protein SCP_0403080 [Sparassis crispa]GBE81934.1 hypothetical protein SCP_0403080 [Sparassis crispa]
MPDFGSQLDVHESQLPFSIQYPLPPPLGAVFDEYHFPPAARQQHFTPALPVYPYLSHYDHVPTVAHYPRATANPGTAYYTHEHRVWSQAVEPEHDPPQRDVIVYDVSHSISHNSPMMSRPISQQEIPESAFLPQQQYEDATDIPDSVSNIQRSNMLPPSAPSTAETEHSSGSDIAASKSRADRPKHSPNQSKKDPKGDPYAPAFIQATIGEKKWEMFTARLAEKRIGRHRGKYKATPTNSSSLQGQDQHVDSAADVDTSSGKDRSASVIDFLVKVEVVKAVLRAYVPHPYNPLKSLTHPYERAPSGHVTLTRSTVLALCGWSNTQFSYWARRAEAVSVLAPLDVRLRAVARALQHQLYVVGVSSAPAAQQDHPLTEGGRAHDGVAAMTEEWVDTCVTGKGLDNIIDEVKKRSGASPFLRGRHSSLDPFGTINGETDGGTNSNDQPAVGMMCMPIFQAEKYVHEVPAETGRDHDHDGNSVEMSQTQSKRRSWDDCSTSAGASSSPVSASDMSNLQYPQTPAMVSHPEDVPQLSFQLSDSRGDSLLPRVLDGGSQHAYAQLRMPLMSNAPRPRSSGYLLPFPKALSDLSYAEMHAHMQLPDQLERPRKKSKSL